MEFLIALSAEVVLWITGVKGGIVTLPGALTFWLPSGDIV